MCRGNVHQQTGDHERDVQHGPRCPVLRVRTDVAAAGIPGDHGEREPLQGTLMMPTEFVGQNGVKITQNTKIAVTGCPKAKKATRRGRP